MSIIDPVSKKHYKGTPIKVVTKQRKVEYLRDEGTSVGTEITEELLMSPESADKFGTPETVGEVKVIDLRTPPDQQRRNNRYDQYASYGNDQQENVKNT